MNCLIFLALIIGAAIATPLSIRKDSWDEINKIEGRAKDEGGKTGSKAIECPKNQDIAAYFGTKRNETKWTYIKSKADWENVKTSGPNSMLVVNVTDDKNNDGKNIILNDLSMDTFVDELVRLLQASTSKKYGVKYNIKTLKAFQNLKTTYPIDGTDAKMPPFPQVFHINADSFEDSGYNLIEKIAVEFNKTENTDYYNCYTISFGWETDKCIHELTQAQVDKLKEKVKTFNKLKSSNLDVDITIDQEKPPGFDFTTVTYKLNVDKLKCYAPRSLLKEIQTMKTNSGDKFFDIHSQIESRVNSCVANKGILADLMKDNKDLAEIKWKLVDKIADLDKTVTEDVIKINVNSDKFLDTTFGALIDKFIEKQTGKSLMLNLTNDAAFNAFWNINSADLDKIKAIPFGIEVTSDFSYEDKKWIDCYTASIRLVSTGDGGYTEVELNTLKNHKIASDEKMYTLAIEKVAKSKTDEIISLLGDGKKKALKLNMPKTTENDGIKSARRILVTKNKNTFVDAGDDAVLTKINSPVTTFDFFEGIETKKQSLNFVKLANCADSITAEKSMLQIEINASNEINACLDKLSENDKNGLHVKLTKIAEVAEVVKAMKYRNFPLWIQLNVDEKNMDFTGFKTSTWYHLVVGSKEALNLTTLDLALKNLEDRDLTLSIRAGDYNTHKTNIDKKLNNKTDMLIWMKNGDAVNTTALRTGLKENNYYLDIPRKFVMDDCPKNNNFMKFFSTVEGLEENLSQLMLSDVLKSENAVKLAVQKKKHMLNFEVELKGGKLIIGDNYTLVDMLQKAKYVGSEQKIGAKITFPNQNAFNAVFEDDTLLELLRNLDRPIWINVNVIKEEKVILDLNYTVNNDLLDCRTLSLGFEGDNKYTEKNVAAMKKLELGSNKKIYVVELLQIGKVWETVKGLTSGGNLITLVSSSGDENNVDYGSMESILDEHKGVFLFDMPDLVRESLNGSGSVSASLLLASILACFAMIFQ